MNDDAKAVKATFGPIVYYVALVVIFLISIFNKAGASPDIGVIVNNIEKNAEQQVKKCHIDSLEIKRGVADFKLGAGELTLFNFGSGRICAMTFRGTGRFKYIAPNSVEASQVKKFTDHDTLDCVFDKATFFFTVDLGNLPDINRLEYVTVDKESWEQLKDARDKEFDHIWINITTQIIGDLLADGPGTYFNAAISHSKIDSYVFIENPYSDDYYCLYHEYKQAGKALRDVISGYSPDNDLPSQRGVIPIDITHYDIKSQIEMGGKMIVKCRIVYNPMRWGTRYIYFPWFYKNKINSVLNYAGDSLTVVRRIDKEGIFTVRADEPGFGIVLNKPMELGQPDSLEISYKCEALENVYGIFIISSWGQTHWYPQNVSVDRATFDLTYDCPKDLEVVSTGNLVGSRIENGRSITQWLEDNPVCYTSFNIGNFDSKNFILPDLPPVKVYISQNIPHKEMALYMGSLGELSNADMLGVVGRDVSTSLEFYTNLFGPCPFDTIKVSEIPASHGMGCPGMVFLYWYTFQTQGLAGADEQFRSHEVAHQWWPNIVTTESYRDTWLMEGLAEYCGYLYFQQSLANMEKGNKVLGFWKSAILNGLGSNSVGSKAGPIILGYRLASSKSEDYNTLVYEKGAYVFHMIRYLMHDYKTGNDDAFIAFLKDLVDKYRNKFLTTERFRALLEGHVNGDMSWFFNQWVYGTDIPEYHFSYTATAVADSKYQVTCHITESNVPADFQMVVPLTVFFDDDRYAHLKVVVDQPEMDVDLPLLPYKPKKILFNTYDAVLCKVKYD